MATVPHSHGLPDPLVDYADPDTLASRDSRRLTLDMLFCNGTLLAAQGRDTHFLALIQLPAPCRRVDGKRARYAVVYR